MIFFALKSLYLFLLKGCLFLFLFLFLAQPLAVDASFVQNTKPLFESALERTENGDFSKALELWNELLEITPENSAALSNRGNVRLVLGDPKGAIVDQTRAAEISPFEIDPYLNRGIAEEALKDWEAAIKDYNWILEQEPDNASALYNLANVSGSKGEWSQARVLFGKAAFSNPGFAMARSSKALCDYQLEKFDDAENELRNLIRRYPMMADVRASLSALLWRKGFVGEAESNWVAASGLDNRYRQRDWLLNIRRWPPGPTEDLMAFLALERP